VRRQAEGEDAQSLGGGGIRNRLVVSVMLRLLGYGVASQATNKMPNKIQPSITRPPS
jgi:hypothetical protein